MTVRFERKKFNIGAPSQQYKDNYDAIFRKGKKHELGKSVQTEVPEANTKRGRRSIPDEAKS